MAHKHTNNYRHAYGFIQREKRQQLDYLLIKYKVISLYQSQNTLIVYPLMPLRWRSIFLFFC